MPSCGTKGIPNATYPASPHPELGHVSYTVVVLRHLCNLYTLVLYHPPLSIPCLTNHSSLVNLGYLSIQCMPPAVRCGHVPSTHHIVTTRNASGESVTAGPPSDSNATHRRALPSGDYNVAGFPCQGLIGIGRVQYQSSVLTVAAIPLGSTCLI